jgi:hypothetical protein
VPTADGSIQCEWHEHGIDLEVEFLSNGGIEYYLLDSRTGKTWGSETKKVEDPELISLVEILENRRSSEAS